MASAREIVLHAWRQRQRIRFDTSGGWHQCSRDKCSIQKLNEHVCMQGKHIISGTFCPMHPKSNIVYVTDLYVCQKVGIAHVCDQRSCRSSCGRCIISGLSCLEQPTDYQIMHAHHKRNRRRSNNVHTCRQAANIMIYDLLFSNRRIFTEIKRAENILDFARRKVQRIIKQSASSHPIYYQQLLDVCVDARLRLRNNSHLLICTTEMQRQQVCQYYSLICINVWNLLMKFMPSRSMFESVVASLLYAMRRGVAYDGIYAIPFDDFMARSLPDAHSIKDAQISRRSFTQAKNALHQAIQEFTSKQENTVEMIAEQFEKVKKPNVLSA